MTKDTEDWIGALVGLTVIITFVVFFGIIISKIDDHISQSPALTEWDKAWKECNDSGGELILIYPISGIGDCIKRSALIETKHIKVATTSNTFN